jgi:preprotein translocase subunit SecD
VLLTLAAVFLYLHFSNGSGFTRLLLAGALVVTSVLLLLPSFRLQLPEYLDSMPKIQLGLDLQGGTHLLLEVKLQAAINNALKRRGDDLKRALVENKLDPADISQSPDGTVLVKLKNPSDRTPFLSLVDKSFPDIVLATADDAGDAPAYTIGFKPRDAQVLRNNAMDQALETIRNRIDQLGVRETTVQKEGDSDILVQLPGIQDPERAKELIGKTAVLEFRFLDDKGNLLMTGDVVTDARVRPGTRMEGPYVEVKLDKLGADSFGVITTENVGRHLAIVLDKTVYSAPVIKEPIPGGDVQINGSFSFEEAHELAIVLRSGALPAPVEIIEERTVGPSLGRDSIHQGELSFVVGAVAVLAFMAIYYNGAGLLADFGLMLNILLLVCVMAALQATLTLPGIAGIVLTLGMSVDANVLVNERMREELRGGKSPREAVKIGYERAWSAIRDSNISTFVAGLILFQFGTGPVKGFAVTLCVGVLTGVFSCFVVTRAWYDYKISMRRLNAISV